MGWIRHRLSTLKGEPIDIQLKAFVIIAETTWFSEWNRLIKSGDYSSPLFRELKPRSDSRGVAFLLQYTLLLLRYLINFWAINGPTSFRRTGQHGAGRGDHSQLGRGRSPKRSEICQLRSVTSFLVIPKVSQNRSVVVTAYAMADQVLLTEKTK